MDEIHSDSFVKQFEGELFNREITEWLNDCPTHKLEIDHIDAYGISLRVRFNNHSTRD